ncbi:hypothetical protein GGU11DRAFT_791351 [Lentinula aff. detonsa]|nr:hypothetical protein GGU11DRAFT_791351 [Lentinula aff. detonsa]
MEPEIRSADTSMQEIETLLRRGVLDGEGANDKLESYIPLKPRLSTLLELHEQNTARADELEGRVAGIMESHTGYVSSSSMCTVTTAFARLLYLRIFLFCFRSYLSIDFELSVTYLEIQIDTLSNLFLAWDDALTDAENRLMRIEREKEERERVGLA